MTFTALSRSRPGRHNFSNLADAVHNFFFLVNQLFLNMEPVDLG